jgi:hypothetical protein
MIPPDLSAVKARAGFFGNSASGGVDAVLTLFFRTTELGALPTTPGVSRSLEVTECPLNKMNGYSLFP